MRIRTITASRMDEALKIIRDQLGPEALILGTRKIKQANGQMGLEITAAINEPAAPTTAAAPLIHHADVKPASTSLAAHGVAPQLIERLTTASHGLKNAGFEGTDALEMVLGKLITFKNPTELFSAGHVHVLLGPTGAGKTTLAAKLAVQAKKQGRSLGLMSLDDQKIGGFEPLEITAESLGDEAHLIKHVADLKAAASALGPRQLIVIDTPGISTHKTASINALLAKLTTLNLPYTCHIVLPGNMAGAEMELVPLALKPFNPTSLIFTKLDDLAHFGALVSTSAHSNLALGLATHSAGLTVAPLTLTPRYLAEVLSADPTLPWTTATTL